MDGIQMLIQLIGGLGLFLYGMKLMGDGLENAAGENLKNILEKVTSNKFMGVLVGAIVTAIIQSSSATSVMVVSFVNAGLMNLTQTVGVTMGANIGTTITAQMVTLDFEAIVPLFIGIGAIMLLTVKKKRNKDLSAIILGFGILFLGMSTMSGAMEPLKESNAFKDIIDIMGNNVFLGILVGLVATAILQSSSATTGILVALGSTGVIEIEVAIPIILGCNIGTCITAVLASASGNKSAKKAAFLNVLIKVIGVIIMLPFIGYLRDVVVYITSDVGKEIANAHTIFNVITSIVLLPFSNVLVGIVNKIMPGEEEISMDGPIY
ncbi:MAG: Na/Pi cotransporter family protein, partial [Clostridium sp.]|nr:Na/Pi cotransporter family protein [Clostridium sp.]